MRLLDLFCGAGGCSVGYSRAGFTEIVGVDNRPMPRYPFTFVQGDALEYLAEHGREFDAIHASPPCQRFSSGTRAHGKTHAEEHPNLIDPIRELLSGGPPWVIENVVGAPLENPVLVCGLALGIGVKRHRLFESSTFLFGTRCPGGHSGNYLERMGVDSSEIGGKQWATVYGGGGRGGTTIDTRRRASAGLAAAAMGIDWMTRDELSQAVPPAYTEFIGKQLLAALEAK